jgi:NADH-quinone oxidoreductase subunit L
VAGKKSRKYFSKFFLWLDCSIINSLVGKLTSFADTRIVAEFKWIDMGNVPVFGSINIYLGMLIDDISALMIVVVYIISFLVHFFSIDYMKGDIRYNRYFAYLGLFTFSMSGIVLTHNMLMMYIFWELVGISSYLLIGFWYEKKSASDAGKKAFIVNRIGDLGMLAGLLILFITYNTFSFEQIFGEIAKGHLPFNSGFWLTVTGVLIFCGAIGKSAQFPLHVWLPDAMEGPTLLVLIHAQWLLQVFILVEFLEFNR